MQRFFKSWMFVAAAAMAFASCSKDDVTAPKTGDKNLTEITINATQAPETRTYFENGQIYWQDAGEKLLVVAEYTPAEGAVEYVSSRATTYVLSEENRKAEFKASLENKGAGTYALSSLYFRQDVLSSNTDYTKYKVRMSAEQSPTLTSYDPEQDVMLGTASQASYSSLPTSIDFTYKHLLAINKITLSGLQLTADENITSVKFLLPEATSYFAGNFRVDLTKGEIGETGYDSNSRRNYVQLNYAEGVVTTGTFDAWSVTYPVTIPAGQKFTVEVVTNIDGVFTKEITLASDLAFMANRYNTMTVDMSAIVAVRPSADLVFNYDGGKLGSSSAYGPQSNTIDEVTITATCGANQPTGLWIGSNSSDSNIKKSALTGYAAIASATSIAETQYGVAALIFDSEFTDVAEVTVNCIQIQGTSTTKAYLVYSTDSGASYTMLDTAKDLTTAGVTFSFDKVASARYAVVFQDTSVDNAAVDGGTKTKYLQVRAPAVSFSK